MEPVLDSCAGMDVHEKKVDVCIAHGPLEKSPKFEIRTFSTMTSDLEDLKSWLKKYNVTTIGMESTGVAKAYENLLARAREVQPS